MKWGHLSSVFLGRQDACNTSLRPQFGPLFPLGTSKTLHLGCMAYQKSLFCMEGVNQCIHIFRLQYHLHLIVTRFWPYSGLRTGSTTVHAKWGNPSSIVFEQQHASPAPSRPHCGQPTPSEIPCWSFISPSGTVNQSTRANTKAWRFHFFWM